MTSVFSRQTCVSFCPASFCTPRPNLPVTPDIFWLPILHSNTPWWKGHLYIWFCLFFFSFLVLILENPVGVYRTVNFSFFGISGWGMFAKSLQSCRLCATPETAAHQASPSLGFSRQEYWSGLLYLPPGDLPDPGIRAPFLMSPRLSGRLFNPSTTWEAH